MSRTAAAALAVAAAALAAAPSAGAAALPVSIGFDAFAPAQVDALPGDEVQWVNSSERRHTVTADDGSYDSGDMLEGDRFARGFDAVGAYTYHCTVHLNMTGEVDVRRVILDPLPAAAVPAGRPVTMRGRSAGAGAVTIEEDTGGGFQAVAQALPDPGGEWSAEVTPALSADYRAVVADGVSQTRRLLVTDRSVRLRATSRGVEVTVTPRAPGARVRIQTYRRERFGWWPSRAKRLDYVSRADFRVRRPARVRAVLVDRDGWTPVATSPVLRLRRR